MPVASAEPTMAHLVGYVKKLIPFESHFVGDKIAVTSLEASRLQEQLVLMAGDNITVALLHRICLVFTRLHSVPHSSTDSLNMI